MEIKKIKVFLGFEVNWDLVGKKVKKEVNMLEEKILTPSNVSVRNIITLRLTREIKDEKYKNGSFD